MRFSREIITKIDQSFPRCHNNLDMQRAIVTYSEGISLF